MVKGNNAKPRSPWQAEGAYDRIGTAAVSYPDCALINSPVLNFLGYHTLRCGHKARCVGLCGIAYKFLSWTTDTFFFFAWWTFRTPRPPHGKLLKLHKKHSTKTATQNHPISLSITNFTLPPTKMLISCFLVVSETVTENWWSHSMFCRRAKNLTYDHSSSLRYSETITNKQTNTIKGSSYG